MRKPRTGIRDLLLPTVVTRDDTRTTPATELLAKNISAPCFVSSTNAALDPYCLGSYTLHQPDSPVEVFQCLSGIQLPNTSVNTKRGPRTMFMTQQLHTSTSSKEHRRSLVFHSRVGDLDDIPDLESVYSSDSADPEQHSYILSMPAIPKIAFEDLSDTDSTTSIRKTYDFKITAVGASVRQGDFLKLPNGPRVSSSRSLHSPQGVRRLRVRVFDTSKYTDVLSAPVRRLPAMRVALEDLPETRKESDDEIENLISDLRLESIKEGSPFQQPDLRCASKEDTNTSARGAILYSDGVPRKSFRAYPRLEPSAIVHFRGRHHRSRAASYQITTGILAERGELDIQPFSGSQRDPRWAPKNGMMIVKVYIPSTDDIWAAYFPTNITLPTFASRWLSKLSLHLQFSGSAMDTPEYYFDDDDFQCWLKHRVRHGRNLPIVGHLDYGVLPSPLLPKDA
ncbi:hypothetical protein AZE42_03675 [Rhizopogon vesiculosus]|uniref:Uncharacterized protein n=1 Tax=Rhizopogon vesiculosus TaxID=180088 RepID=A0A1J8Q891_9AGAM|nr:hypothetical protein AZE42_03675 [Rhizopogon vesiculosus]